MIAPLRLAAAATIGALLLGLPLPGLPFSPSAEAQQATRPGAQRRPAQRRPVARPAMAVAPLAAGAAAGAIAGPTGAALSARPPGAGLPSDPPGAPPPPARLAPATPGGPAAPPEPPIALPAGMEALAGGGWRLRFEGEALAIGDSSTAALAELGRRLASRPQGRITLLAQASGPVTDSSAARRLSLARALAVKQGLAAGGLPDTRIDIRAMGRTAEAVDAVDVQPPEVQRAAGR